MFLYPPFPASCGGRREICVGGRNLFFQGRENGKGIFLSPRARS